MCNVKYPFILYFAGIWRLDDTTMTKYRQTLKHLTQILLYGSSVFQIILHMELAETPGPLDKNGLHIPYECSGFNVQFFICPKERERIKRGWIDSPILADSKIFDGKPHFGSVDDSDSLMGDKLGEGSFSMVPSFWRD